MKILYELYWVFFKIAMVTFGGGYAMLPLLQEEIVKKRKWASEKNLLDYYAISQCTPGIIGVNVATFIGYRRAGKLGGLIATIGVITPSVLLATFAALVFRQYMDNEYVMHALKGIRVFMVAMIAYTLVTFWKKSVVDYKTFTIFLICCLVLGFFSPNIILVIIMSIALGHLFSLKRLKK